VFEHTLEDCTYSEAEAAREGYEHFKKHRRIVPYSCCYLCKLPQRICNSSKLNEEDSGYIRQSEIAC
jgi:hypothetical protein